MPGWNCWKPLGGKPSLSVIMTSWKVKHVTKQRAAFSSTLPNHQCHWFSFPTDLIVFSTDLTHFTDCFQSCGHSPSCQVQWFLFPAIQRGARLTHHTLPAMWRVFITSAPGCRTLCCWRGNHRCWETDTQRDTQTCTPYQASVVRIQWSSKDWASWDFVNSH